MGFRTTAVLLGVVGGLVLLLVWTAPGPVEPASIGEPILGGRRVASAQRIVIERQTLGQALVLESRSDHFQLVEPVDDLASLAVLSAMSGSYDSALRLVAYTAEEVEADPGLLEETGVASPRTRISFEFSDGETIQVDLGQEAPLGQDIFLRMGDVIYRGGLDLYTILELNVDDMREHLVFRHGAAEVRELTVERTLPGGETEALRLERRGNEFVMVEPIQGRVDTVNMPVFLANVLGLRLDEFVPGVMRLPPRPPDIAVTVRGNGEEEVVLWFQDDRSMLGTMRSRGVSFHIGASEAQQFFETAVENLRAHQLIPFDTAEIQWVALDPGDDRPARLRRTGEEFSLTEPVGSVTNFTAVNKVLQGLRNLGVEQFMEGEPTDPDFGLVRDFFTVSVLGQFESGPIHVHLGRDEGAFTYARRSDEAYVVKIQREVADLLRQPWINFVAPRVQRITVPVGELRLVAGDGREVAFHRSDGRWLTRGGEEAPPATAELMESLVDLRANAVLDPASPELDPISAGDLEPYALQLRRANSDLLATLQIYDRGEGQPLLARNDRTDVLFELSTRDSRDIRDLLK